MNDLGRFLSALHMALSTIERDRHQRYHVAALAPLHQRIKEVYATRLRRTAAKLTELDVDVMDDLMKVVKKLGRDSTPLGSGIELRLKLTLNLIEHLLVKDHATSPDHLLWLFNSLYQGLTKIVPATATQASNQVAA
jgi:hypothetical protein